MRELVVLKLGGSLITEKDKPFTLRRRVLERLGEELSNAGKPLILVHGGGSYAHPVAKRYDVSEGYRSARHLEGFVETAIAVRRLNLEVVEILSHSGLKSIGVPASTIILTKSGRILACNFEPVFSALDLGLAPVTCGDVVFDRELGFTVLSGDAIASYMASRLRADRLIYAVDVDGVYVRDRATNRVVLAEEFRPGMPIEPLGESVEDVTGGIVRKLEEGFRAAEKGVEVYVVNGLREGVVESAVRGERVRGTRLKP